MFFLLSLYIQILITWKTTIAGNIPLFMLIVSSFFKRVPSLASLPPMPQTERIQNQQFNEFLCIRGSRFVVVPSHSMSNFIHNHYFYWSHTLQSAERQKMIVCVRVTENGENDVSRGSKKIKKNWHRPKFMMNVFVDMIHVFFLLSLSLLASNSSKV